MEPAPTLDHRRASSLPAPPSNPRDRKVITLRPPPLDTDFLDHSITRVIGHTCLSGWPTAALTWAEAPASFRDLAWQEFVKHYQWDPSIDERVKLLYTQKCAVRTKGNISYARNIARQRAEKLNPGHGQEHMHTFPPWWCTPQIWIEMCEKWSDDKWVKKSMVASTNRSAGTPPGGRTKGTYKGGTKSQLQYMTQQEAQQPEGGPMNWKDLYLLLRNNLPDATRVVETYDKLMLEKYPEEVSRPSLDQELWEQASVVNKGYVKGIGQKRSRPTSGFTCSSGASVSSTAASTNPIPQQSAQDLVRAICEDQSLLALLREHIVSTLGPDEIAAAVARAAQSQSSNNAHQDQ